VQKPGERGVFAFGAALALCCAALTPWLISLSPIHSIGVPASVALIALFGLAEVTLIHVPLRRDTHTVSFNEVPLVLGLFLLPPAWLLGGAVLATIVTLFVHRRQRGVKLFFNTVQVGVQCVVATVVFRAIVAGATGASIRAYGAAFVAAVIADLVSALLITVAISLYRGEAAEFGAWSLVFGVVASIAKTALAIVAVSLVVNADTFVLLPLALSAGCMYAAFRAHAALFERHRRLEMLYRFTTAVGCSVRRDDVATAVVSEARDLLRATEATLIVQGTDESTATWSANVGGDGPLDGTADTLERRLPFAGTAEFSIAVRGPIGVDRTFDDVDDRLLEALCSHAAVALQNCELVERLSTEVRDREYRATHDIATGLPNLRQFIDMTASRLESGAATAIVVVAVDDLSDIEQTIGYQNVEQLVATLARRIEANIDGDAMLARLRADAFGLITTPTRFERCTHLVREAAAQAVQIEGLDLAITVTFGWASAPDDAGDARTLLRFADGGLHTARREHLSVARHQTGAEEAVRHRLTLAQELRQAFERRELSVFYQPKVDLATGRPLGAEALVRWNHPTRGLIMPDEFIPIAEHTGLIGPLTEFVLREALIARQRWADELGQELNLSVNISPRSFTDPSFVEKVLRELIRANCPAGGVTLELTESQLMSDPERAARVLTDLHDVGIRISIDDFGTGYSSLTSLRSLPLDEVKIDKSFVLELPANESDAVIVRSTAGLAQNLALSVVAEGIEDPAARAFLLDIGVTIGQGYLFAKPLAASAFEMWLREQLDGASTANAPRQRRGADS
jgi:diguanylate cyclase (GGDEF)-like protein